MIFNWAACGAAQFIKWVSFFRGGGEYFWEVVVGVHRPRHLIFTVFQSNIYKVNPAAGLCRVACS